MADSKFAVGDAVRFADGRRGTVLASEFNPVANEWQYILSTWGGWFLESDLYGAIPATSAPSVSLPPMTNKELLANRAKLMQSMFSLRDVEKRQIIEALDWPIRLRVPIVVVYSGGPSIFDLRTGYGVAAEVREFYRETCGVELQTIVSGQIASTLPVDLSYVNLLQLSHAFEHGGQHFLVLIRADANRIGPYLGQTFTADASGTYVGGFCAVAGTDDRRVGPAVIHELGHCFGLDHQDNTFMRAVLETENRIVTAAQRAKIREVAWRFGGL